ncbi:NUDIX domain-containing protein [Candidatus Bathyarchaeota archaeon]|nr:NUDIX domain-containing protein [Candidatus Bathyarchaeota archaeon]
MNTKEYFYVVDEDDNVIGAASREECHSNAKLIHRSVYIFLVNSRGEILIQRRSVNKDLYPGFYTASATGHVNYGEGYDIATKRELKEELGVDAPLRRLCKVKSFSDVEREISMIYVCRYDGPIRFDRNEIDEVVFMSIDDIERSLKTGDKKFAYGFKVAFKEFLRHRSLVDSRLD